MRFHDNKPLLQPLAAIKHCIENIHKIIKYLEDFYPSHGATSCCNRMSRGYRGGTGSLAEAWLPPAQMVMTSGHCLTGRDASKWTLGSDPSEWRWQRWLGAAAGVGCLPAAVAAGRWGPGRHLGGGTQVGCGPNAIWLKTTSPAECVCWSVSTCCNSSSTSKPLGKKSKKHDLFLYCKLGENF